MSKGDDKMKVCIYLAKGFEEIEALTVVDILRRADIQVDMISITGDLVVEGAHHIKVMADILLEDVDYTNSEMNILPGGMPGTIHLEEHKELEKIILDWNQNKKYIGAICAAPRILGKLNLLQGKKATCYPGFEKYLYGAEYVKESVVKSDHIITSRGPGTAMEFALELVRVLKGEKIAADLKTQLIL